MKKVQQLFNSARNGLFGSRAAKESPMGLAARAGKMAGAGEESLIEQLEKREYLFVLTVSDADPSFVPDPNGRPHYGTVTANFAYFLPFLQSNLPAITSVAFPAGGVGDAASPGPGVVLTGPDPRTFDVEGVDRNRMAAWLESRMAAVSLSLYGRFEDDPNTPQVELPTSIQVFDLYGRDMQQRLDIGRPSPFDQRLDGSLPGTIDLGADAGRPALPAGPGDVPPAVEGIDPAQHNEVPVDALEATGDRGTTLGLAGTLTPFDRTGIDPTIGDGVPDMNDGLGMVVIIQSDALTRINMMGGRAVRVTDQSSLDAIDTGFDDVSFYGIDIADNAGAQGWWDEQGFGFDIIPGATPDISGLPEVGGGIVFGAPFIRDNTDDFSYFGVTNNVPGDAVDSSRAALVPDLNFTNLPLFSGPLTVDGVTINTPIMGIRTLRPEQAVAEINVPGLMMGTVNISGSLGLFYTQHMLGSMSVTGDVGQFYVGGTMGYWIREDQRGQNGGLENFHVTGSTISVGGRVGQIFVAGRNRANIFITGDIVNPRLRIEGSTYSEVETVFGINPADEDALDGVLNTGVIRSGFSTYRNDGFSTAEFISSGLGGTTISGSLGLMDPLNDEDLADFYAFAANGNQTVQLNVTFPNPFAARFADQAYVRVYDQNGNLIATHQGTSTPPSDATNPTTVRAGANFQFNAPATGVYYLVVGVQGDELFNTSLAYTVTMSGQAATTLGQFVTGGGIVGTTLTVTNGAVGRISGGFGVVGPDGEDLLLSGADLGDRTEIPAADYVDSFGFTINVPSLYNFIVGGDVGSGSITSTGVIGGVQISGGVMSMSVVAARQLATFDVGGQVGVQETTNRSRNAGQTGTGPAAVLIRTGGPGVVGHIGRLRFGDIVRGDHFTVQVSADSRIDLIEAFGGFTNTQPTFIMGQGADIRFATFPTIDIQNPGQQVLQNFSLPITVATPLTFTDDSGVTFTVRVTGNGSVATLRYAPAGAFGGGVVGQIIANLGTSGNLIITTTSAGVLSLGDVIVTGGNQGSQVQFTGPAEIDVRSLRVNSVLSAITNTTPDGDLLSVDALGVRRITANGSIGSTQNYMLGLNDIAVNVGIVGGQVNAVGGPIGIPNGLINAWGGALVDVPFVFDTADAEDRTLEDSGSPVDHILNGVVIRTGNVDLVSARGSVGDVITQGGAAARVTSIIANSDGVNTTLGFEGIVGSIFVGELTTLDVGDGILGPGPSPLARAGVFAIDDIITINAGTRVLNPILTGVVIVAGNADNAARDVQGIGTINIRGADLDRSFVHVANLDSWWRSARYGADNVAPSGTIANVRVTNGDITRTDFHATNIGTISITGGLWDASSAQAPVSIGTISADGFVSSLSNVDPLAYYFNQIRAGLDVGTVRATGDIQDMFISAGRNNTSISAQNLTRSNLDLRGNAGTITIRGDVRASSIGSGLLQRMAVTGDIRNSTVRISGAILSLTAGGDITDTEIISSGPDGRINTLTAGGTMTGTVTSSGPIGTIRTTRGDINLTITTTQLAGAIGNINTVQSGRDLILDLNLVDGTSVGTLRAARHIGRRLLDGSTPDAIDVPGNITTITAGGVLYSDVRASGTLGTVTMGRALAYLPGADYATDAVITASARINSVSINGDFDGSIVSYSGGIGTVTITNGSFRAGTAERPNRIEARDGDITTVRVVNGHLLGDVLAPDGSIATVAVTATGGSVFGSIGINPDLSTATQTTPMSERRTQLPQSAVLTAGRDGPTISAGVNIGTITAAGGIFESTISAGRLISTITVSRGIDNAVAGAASTDDATVITAGDRINTVTVTQQARGTFVGSGVTSLGADAQPGGTAGNADTVKSGTIGTLNFRGGTDAVTIAAGLVAGVDGLYNTADDNSAPGVSTIQSVQVTGTANNTVVRTDSGTPSVSANLLGGTNSVGGQTLPVAEGFAYDGAIPINGIAVTSAGRILLIGGQLRRVVFTGSGTAVYSSTLNTGPGAGTIVLTGTTTATLRIEAAPAGAVAEGTLRAIVGRDDASLGTLNETVDVSGLTVILDGSINTVTTRNLTNSPIRTGQSLGKVTSGVAGGTTNLIIESRGTIGTVRTLGGVSNGVNPASIRGLTIGATSIGGVMQGIISSARDITSLTVTGQMAINSGVRAGYNIGAVTLGSMDTAALSAGGNITSVRVNGNVIDSAIVSGIDLGTDAAFGGTGTATDSVSNGNMGAVNITGSLSRSDISAGAYQGADGFLGTNDDQLGEGRSSLGNVTITGSATGSVLNNQSYRIISNGTIGNVKAVGAPFVGAQNLLVRGVKAQPDPLAVAGVNVGFIGGTYFATIGFNQPVDPASISGALTITEVRAAGIEIDLVEGVDYTVTYVAGTSSALVEFSADIINRSLGVVGTNATQSPLAGPGLYRFDIDSAVIRGQTDATRLDGDGDGVAELNDDWRQFAVVGDAGDRLEASFGINPDDLSNIDFFAPTNINPVLSDPFTGTAIVNRTFGIQGVIGDHPDFDPVFFGAGGDLDIYTLTLQQGQILDMAVVSGGAAPALFSLGAQAGRPLLNNPAVQTLPDGRQLVLTTGTFVIVVAAFDVTPLLDPGNFGNPQVISGGNGGSDRGDLVNVPASAATGDYILAIRVIDDGDNGFAGVGSSGNGSNVETAPLPAAFAGIDGVLGTQDDLASITVGEYIYQLDPGANNVLNGNGTGNTTATRSDDRVIGANVLGTEQVRTAGADGVFGTNDDVTTINDAIGNRNAVGGAVVTASDVDIFRLNAGAPVAAGQRYRFTLRTNEYGGDLGSIHTPRPLPGGAGAVGVPGADSRGEVQFALFEQGTNQVNGRLVAQAPNPEGYRAVPNTVVATDGYTTYGYDANGDYYMELTIPPSQADGTADASFALYVQGFHQSRYNVEIVRLADGPPAEAQSQNFLIETNGGLVDWLNAYTSTRLTGFSGVLNAAIPGLGMSTREYILTNVIANLNAFFTTVGVNITISRTSADFIGQEYSTVFITDSLEPADQFNQGFFGASERRDVLNADRSDQAVVFAPSINSLGIVPDQDGMDAYVRSMTAAVAQRMGELLGLSYSNSGTMTDGLAGAAGGLTLPDLDFNTTPVRLGQTLRSDFILGTQNDTQLLRRIFQLTT